MASKFVQKYFLCIFAGGRAGWLAFRTLIQKGRVRVMVRPTTEIMENYFFFLLPIGNVKPSECVSDLK